MHIKKLSTLLLLLNLLYSTVSAHEVKLSKIALTSSSSCHIRKLTVGVNRLTGKYKPTFSEISTTLKSAQFTQVPWRSSPQYSVTVVESGYLVFFGMSAEVIEKKLGRKSTEAIPLLKGAYLGNLFKPRSIYVKVGEQFKTQGYEACLIAASIFKVEQIK